MEKSTIINQESSFTEEKQKLTDEATNFLAARIIDNINFPQKTSLPRFAPLPFSNFGYFYLFDHSKYLNIIYQTVIQYKQFVSHEIRYGKWYWSIGSLIILTGIIFFMNPDIIISSFVISFFIYFVADSYYKETLNKKIKDKKSKIIENILLGKWEKDDKIKIPARLEDYFNKSIKIDICANETPVLIVFDNENPFPGFGKLQTEDTFICRPKSKIDFTENSIFNILTENIENSLKDCGIKNISFGKVIVLSYDSISINSPWLDENKVPILSKSFDSIEMLEAFDLSASVRSYFVVEVLFPKYKSSTCFFVRIFKAGNSVGCHIALTTMGPPEYDKSYFSDRLTRFKKEKDKIYNSKYNSSDFKSLIEMEIHSIKLQGNSKNAFQKAISVPELDEFDPIYEKEYDETRIQKKIGDILKYELSWPGKYYYYLYNTRETYSLTFGGDFYGKPELIGSIRTVNDQISRLIIEGIEKQGFDVSEYKDKDGKITINAENIDKLVVGEVINVKSDEKEIKKSNIESVKNDNKTK